MSNTFSQNYDQWTDQPRQRPEVEAQMEIAAAEAFIADVGDEYYASKVNWHIIQEFLRKQNVPISRRNLMLSWTFLSAQGLLETGDDGPEVTITPAKKNWDAGIKTVHAGPVLRYDNEGIAANSLLREKPERLTELAGEAISKRQAADAENRSLSEIGKPVSQELTAKFRQSLKSNHRVTTMSTGNARAAVAELYPDMDTCSIQFSRLVAELMKENQQ